MNEGFKGIGKTPVSESIQKVLDHTSKMAKGRVQVVPNPEPMNFGNHMPKKDRIIEALRRDLDMYRINMNTKNAIMKWLLEEVCNLDPDLTNIRLISIDQAGLLAASKKDWQMSQDEDGTITFTIDREVADAPSE